MSTVSMGVGCKKGNKELSKIQIRSCFSWPGSPETDFLKWAVSVAPGSYELSAEEAGACEKGHTDPRRVVTKHLLSSDQWMSLSLSLTKRQRTTSGI